jgi:hypothetical protein
VTGMNPKVGDTLYIGVPGYRGLEYHPATVTRVGKKYFYVGARGRETRFEIGCKEGAQDSNTEWSNYRNVIFSSEAVKFERDERARVVAELRHVFEPYVGALIPERVTTESLKKALALITGNER